MRRNLSCTWSEMEFGRIVFEAADGEAVLVSGMNVLVT